MKIIDKAKNLFKLVKDALTTGVNGDGLQQGSGYTKKYEQLPMYDYLFAVGLPDVFSTPDATTGNAPNFDPRIGSIGGKIKPEEINHRVYAIEVPHVSFEVHKNAIKSKYWYSAKHTDIGSVVMRIDEMEDSASKAYILAWMKRIKNSDGTYNPPAFYKKDIQIIKIAAGSKDKIQSMRFKGCFPSTIADESLSFDNSGVIQYTVTFNCDDVEYDIIDPETTKKIAREYDKLIKANTIQDESAFNFSLGSLSKILGRVI